jgi:hypothetical protein
MKPTAFVFIAILATTGACTYEKGERAEPRNNNDTTAVTYTGDIKPILVTYCYGQGEQACHVTATNQGATGDFTTYQGLKDKVDNGTIESRVFAPNGGMPPPYSTGPTSLTAGDLAKFKKWVDQGAPNN